MKKLILISVIASVICSCGEISNNKRNNEATVSQKQEANEADIYRAEMQDKLVDLSFMGFKLGAPFSKALYSASQNKEIRIINRSIGKIDGSVVFGTMLNSLDVECKVCSFQDTISSLVVLSKDSGSPSNFRNLYVEKYGKPCDDDYSTSKWRFKNGGIEIATHTTSKTRIEMIPGREHLSKTNLQNYREVTDTYFEMLSITYNDYSQMKKIRDYESVEKQKADSLRKIQEEQDRIKQEAELQKVKTHSVNAI